MARPDQSYPPQETFNPYASPEVGLQSSPEVVSGSPLIPCTVGDIMGRAWTVYQGRMGFCIGVMLISFIVAIGAQIVMGLGMGVVSAITPDPIIVGATTVVLFLGYGFVALWVGMGQSIAYLKVAQGRLATVGDVFTGGRILLKVILAVFILGFAVLGVMILSSIPGGIAGAVLGSNNVMAGVVMGVGLLIGYALVLVYWINVSQFVYVLIANPAMSAMAALKYSIQITRGHWWTITAVILLAGLVNVVGMLLLGIGLIFSVPYSLLILAVLYTSLAPQPEAQASKSASPYFD